ncbi:Lar family restriction alleviation protein [Cronobacter sakazakii]|uniref:Lar family restriction alleviation protein n=1 Tax=Cronobacter sakazakii TaxID=28141 RepID=UPI001F507948|nr:hypothetical protein [Cronobacter sakazakii]MCI0287321.1 hypothetical protein [Cronobacter sakazakii]MDI7608789.1 hypothetical protein [Cronobacter sakazakii]MDI7614358.1 hypothetical protein [Cronobacter sakazakii]
MTLSKEKAKSAIEALMRHPTAYFGEAEAREVAGWLSELLALRERAEPVSAESYPDDSDLLFAIELNEDSEDFQTAQWLKELRRRRAAPPAPVVPEGLRIALSNAGIAAPESDEALWASQQDYIQALVTWVKDRKPFKLAPVVPAVRAEPVAGENLPCPFCGGACDPAGWLSEQTSGPECENCGATAENIEAWNRRTAAPVVPDDTKRLDWLDAQNKRLNEYYGTAYGWKFDANFQRNAMMLNDSNYPVMTVRQAIDEAMLAAPCKEG